MINHRRPAPRPPVLSFRLDEEEEPDRRQVVQGQTGRTTPAAGPRPGHVVGRPDDRVLEARHGPVRLQGRYGQFRPAGRQDRDPHVQPRREDSRQLSAPRRQRPVGTIHAVRRHARGRRSHGRAQQGRRRLVRDDGAAAGAEDPDPDREAAGEAEEGRGEAEALAAAMRFWAKKARATWAATRALLTTRSTFRSRDRPPDSSATRASRRGVTSGPLTSCISATARSVISSAPSRSAGGGTATTTPRAPESQDAPSVRAHTSGPSTRALTGQPLRRE